jgi:hypothetical protein
VVTMVAGTSAQPIATPSVPFEAAVGGPGDVGCNHDSHGAADAAAPDMSAAAELPR